MARFTKCNTTTGHYKSDDDIDDFKFKVTLKRVDRASSEIKSEIVRVSWQEKILPEPELERVTYAKIVTYVHEDEYDVDGEEPSSRIQEMFVVAKLSGNHVSYEFSEDGDLERVLFILRWDPEDRRLAVSPDFNDVAVDPYSLEVNRESKCVFHFGLEHLVDELDRPKVERVKISDEIRRYKNESGAGDAFSTFSASEDAVVVEIASAENFPGDSLYVEYAIDRSRGHECECVVLGTTQTSRCEGQRVVRFGHSFEATTAYGVRFEIVSRDSRGRHRTEGVCRLDVPSGASGRRSFALDAHLPLTEGGDARRYLRGGRPGTGNGRARLAFAGNLNVTVTRVTRVGVARMDE